MRAILFIILAIAAACAQAKETLVSRTEASAVFAKTSKIIRNVLGTKGTGKAFSSGSAIASREAILMQLDAMVTEASSKMRVTPPRVRFNPALMTLKEAGVRKIAERLAVQGFVDRVGPLITGKQPGLTPQEFGDAIGFFLSRLAEVTHKPSTEFSPALQPG